MFVLTVIKDEIRIHPSRFGAPVLDSLVEEIDDKYINKVGSSFFIVHGAASAARGSPPTVMSTWRSVLASRQQPTPERPLAPHSQT